MLFFFPRDVLDEILDLIESVSEGFPTYSNTIKCFVPISAAAQSNSKNYITICNDNGFSPRYLLFFRAKMHRGFVKIMFETVICYQAQRTSFVMVDILHRTSFDKSRNFELCNVFKFCKYF